MSTDMRSVARAFHAPGRRRDASMRRFARRGAYQDTKVLVALVVLGLAILVGVVVFPTTCRSPA